MYIRRSYFVSCSSLLSTNKFVTKVNSHRLGHVYFFEVDKHKIWKYLISSWWQKASLMVLVLATIALVRFEAHTSLVYTNSSKVAIFRTLCSRPYTYKIHKCWTRVILVHNDKADKGGISFHWYNSWLINPFSNALWLPKDFLRRLYPPFCWNYNANGSSSVQRLFSQLWLGEKSLHRTWSIYCTVRSTYFSSSTPNT